MSAIVGVSMILAAILIVRAAKIGSQLASPPWWASDLMCTNALVPAFAGLSACGAAALGLWLRDGQWRAASVSTAAEVAIAAAVFAALWRGMSAWQGRARPGAPVIPLGPAQSGARQPQGEPPLRKAA
jgi:hypothetical protein